MKNKSELFIFGEVLFDCFPTGEEILGGAPFNVACHLQALGNQPVFISKIGEDDFGHTILQAMTKAGMSTVGMQRDATHPTGRVEVTLHNNDPRYNIVENSAFDFITQEQLPNADGCGILYHGTLGVRNSVSRTALRKLCANKELKVFLDVNLREPWYNVDDVRHSMQNAHWVKMNLEELQILSNASGDTEQIMAQVQSDCELEQLIVTRGEEGAIVRTAQGDLYSFPPPEVTKFTDTVGAGDAFSSVYIHGIRAGWSIDTILKNAQRFAAQVIGLRGATTSDLSFYETFIASLTGA